MSQEVILEVSQLDTAKLFQYGVSLLSDEEIQASADFENQNLLEELNIN
ncbi:hypothetical protein [Helicobacter sp. 10-6591]|nr:hypothetical protein [Helicobacter sp. 10-6591]MCI7485182.1 hypothetical protein [Helicobacter sp.]